MEWISVKDDLPEIDYENKKSSCRVRIKLNNNDEFIVDCFFTELFKSNENGTICKHGYIFYELKNGHIYHGVTHWMPLPEVPKDL